MIDPSDVLPRESRLEALQFFGMLEPPQYLLSGHMFPLDMLAGIPTGVPGVSVAEVVRFLPFEYTAYFPAAVWLGKVRGAELVRSLVVEAAWVVVMMAACRLAWRRGTARYSAFGG